MLKTAPDPIDVQDLQFKLHCRIQVFNNTQNTSFVQPCSLVTCASRFGLIFIGTNCPNIQVIQLKHLEEYSKSDGDTSDYPRRNFTLPSPPTHISVNCEHTVLAVVVSKNNSPCVIFYDVKSFWRQEVMQLGEVRLSATPGVHIVEVNWNPALAAVFTACKSDGSLGIYEMKNSGIDINELPTASGATCFCWSPKGKQIAVGSRDGKITQYKPDLKAVKVINAPPLKEPHSLQSLQWVSNYQFIGIFQPANPSDAPSFVVVDAPKTGEPTFTNYFDICYSNGTIRPVQFYTILLQNWNILMAASSNSMEVGILSSSGDSWTQWIMGDAARAELPLSSNRQETLPIGFGLDIGRTKPLPWGESTLQPVPLLLLLSHHGTLCCFNVVNLKAGIPSICTPPDPINDTTGLHHFVPGEVLKSVPISKPQEVPKTQEAPILASGQPQQVNTSSAPSSIFKTQSTPQTLFGGQATLTPVVPTNKPTPQTLFGGQATLTPVVPTNKPTPQTLFGGQPSLTPVVPTNKSTPPTTQPSFIPSYQLVSPNETKPADSLATKPAQEEPSKSETVNFDQKAEEEIELIFSQMVTEECIFLESELKAVLHQGRALKLNLGTDDDKTRIVETTRMLEDFFKELVEICTTQSAEVHILKQNLLQSMAWYEEANSRNLTSRDESMMMIIRAQPLDSASEKKLQDIRHINYYLESQIAQAHLALDEQWDNFQDYCKKTRKMQIPTMEMIFQTMVKQNAILRKQSYVLKDIANRIKNKSRSVLGPSLLVSMENAKDLPEELKRLRMDPEDIRQIQYERVMKRKNNLTMQKADSFKSLLKNREYSRIAAVKPQLSSSIIQASPSNKQRLSLFTPRTPPMFKDAIHFVQSTPIPVSDSATPIEGLQNFALKFEVKNFNNLGEKSFAPLTKGKIAGSPNSAFVSTSFGSGVATATSSTSSFKQPIMTSIASMAKPNTGFQVATSVVTQPVTSVNKPFAFGSSLQVGKTTVSTVVTDGLPMKFGFNSQPQAATSVFGSGDTKTLSTISNTASGTSLFNSSASKTANFTTAPPKTTAPTLFFGSISSTSIAPTSSVSSSSIFGGSKPFAFATQPTAISAVQSQPIASVSTASSTGFNLSKSPTTLQLAPSTKSTTQAAATVVTQTAINLSTTKTTAQSSIFSVSTTTTTSGIKSSIFSPAQTTTSITTTPVVSVASIPSTSSIAGTSLTSLLSAKPSTTSSIFGSASQSSSISFSGLKLGDSSKPSTFGSVETSTAKPSIFGSNETSITTKPSIFGSTDTNSSTKPSIFGGTETSSSTKTSIFGGNEPNATTTKPSIFASADSSSVSTKTSIFRSTEANATTTTTTTTKPSIFGGAETSAPSTKPSIFGSTETTATSTKPALFGSGETTTTTTTSSIFGTGHISTTSTAPSLFPSTQTGSAPTKPSIFGSGEAFTTTSTKPLVVFGGTDASAAKPPLFGQVPTTTTATSLFGAAATPTTQTSSIFGGVPSTASATFGFGATTQSSIFGSSVSSPSTTTAFGPATATTTQSIFGGVPSSSVGFGSATPTTQSSIFGSVPSTSAPPAFASPTSTSPSLAFGAPANQTSIFGSSTTSQPSVFGSPVPTTTQPPAFGMFGNATNTSPIFGSPATTTQSSIFGTTNQTSVFGAATTTGTAFGQNQSVFDTSKSTPSVFGQPSAFGSTGSSFGSTSVFGGSSSFGQTSSVFGGAPTSTSGSIFGSTPTTNTGFGSSGSVFGSPVSSTPSVFGSSNAFSSTATQPSTASFGFGTLNVGSTPATSSAGFGSTPPVNPFGSPTGTTTSFGSNTGSIFGNTSSSFGSGGGGFGQSAFGQQASFGQNTFGTGFGQQPSGPFSGGAGSVAQSGFGAGSPTFQKQGGFGSGPVFGGTPAFGSTPSFGGAPAFGSTAAFGSPSKVFGAGGSTAFGASPTPQNTGFGNLANQPTVGFGNLAQQASNAQASNTPFSGNSSFSSWR